MTTYTAKLDSDGTPNFIERDTYVGHWQIVKSKAAMEDAGQTIGATPAAELAQQADENGMLVIREYCGQSRPGRHLFTRTRYLAAPDGSLVAYRSDGTKLLRHPADRIVRYLGRAA